LRQMHVRLIRGKRRRNNKMKKVSGFSVQVSALVSFLLTPET
jgi:hypothetical protein